MNLSQGEIHALIGMKARLWDFRASHDHLVVKLMKGDEERFLVLSGCEEIQVPVFWRVESPGVRPIGDGLFELSDTKVRIVFQDASLHAEYSRA